MKNLRDWLFPTSLLTAWALTAAYTISLVAGSPWIA